MIDPYPYEWPLIIPKNVGMYAMRFVPRDNPSDVFTLIVKWDGENWLDEKFGARLDRTRAREEEALGPRRRARPRALARLDLRRYITTYKLMSASDLAEHEKAKEIK